MTVIYEKKDAIAYITLDRPRSLNSLSRAMGQRLAEIWLDFDQDDALKVAILTGAGRAFCAGVDMREAVKGLRPGAPMGGRGPTLLPGGTSKPMIAAVNGAVVGGGLGLVLHCDIA